MHRPPLEKVHFEEVISGANVRIGRNRNFDGWIMTSPDIAQLYVTSGTPEELRREGAFVIAQLQAMKAAGMKRL